MTDWVTIKVPAEVRDKARDHDPTYGELISFGVEAYDAGVVGANDDGDVWVDVADNDTVPDARQITDAAVAEMEAELADVEGPDMAKEIADAVAARLDYAEVATRTADEVERRLTR